MTTAAKKNPYQHSVLIWIFILFLPIVLPIYIGKLVP